MRQLVQLQQRADDFKALNAEVVVVYREESSGVAGLKKILAKTPTKFRLGLDLNKKSSKAYSPEDMTFDNYVVDSKGVVRGVIEGTKPKRATPDALLKILKDIEAGG